MLLVTAKIVFWISVWALVHSYGIYPLFVRLFAKNKTLNHIVFEHDDDLPFVSIIMAVRNAEYIIEKKIRSILSNGYQLAKIESLIGSDASEDKTNEIISSLIKQFPTIKLTEYSERSGKIKIINDLSSKANGDILLFTDANAIPENNSILHLVKHFNNQDIVVVCANLINNTSGKRDIYIQEDVYLKNEIKLKYNEGVLWGNVMGAYGAFFAIRKREFRQVPENFLVDDFFISFNAILDGKKAILEPKAVVYEQISGDIQDEKKKKIRISSGNFQNLTEFAHIFFSKKLSLTFSFLSHKVLRWIGPIFILLIIISVAFLFTYTLFYKFVAVMLLFSLFSSIIDYLFRKFGIHIILLRFITHYYYMNLGLLIGLLKYIKGVKTNVWEPTKRKSKS